MHSLGICYHLQLKLAQAQTCYEVTFVASGVILLCSALIVSSVILLCKYATQFEEFVFVFFSEYH